MTTRTAWSPITNVPLLIDALRFRGALRQIHLADRSHLVA
jgi:hypothetical protein